MRCRVRLGEVAGEAARWLSWVRWMAFRRLTARRSRCSTHPAPATPCSHSRRFWHKVQALAGDHCYVLGDLDVAAEDTRQLALAAWSQPFTSRSSAMPSPILRPI